MKNSIYMLGLIFFFSGCAGITPDPEKEGKIYERKGVSTLIMPSDTREVYFKDSRSFERHCRAPGPDVSIQTDSGISLDSSVLGKSEDLSDTNGETGLSLGGRDPAVLLTRELMYRACELVSNLNADKKTTIYIYNRFLKTVEKSIKMQQIVGTASATASAQPNSIKNTAGTIASASNELSTTDDSSSSTPNSDDSDSSSGNAPF